MDHGRQLAARPVLMNAKSWLPSNALRRLFSFQRQDMIFNFQKIVFDIQTRVLSYLF